MLNEPLVEIDKTQECMQLSFIFGSLPLSDTFDLGRIHGYLILQNLQAEVIDSYLMQETFLWFQVQLILHEDL